MSVSGPAKSVLCLHLQCRRHPDRSGHPLSDLWHTAIPDHCGGRDGVIVGKCCRKCFALARHSPLTDGAVRRRLPTGDLDPVAARTSQ
jgi:hypothetical protein